MADNKKSTPIDTPKVKRGVKEALTPGVKPEKEQTPVEDVISRELTKIVEQINFDAKFQTMQDLMHYLQNRMPNQYGLLVIKQIFHLDLIILQLIKRLIRFWQITLNIKIKLKFQVRHIQRFL